MPSRSRLHTIVPVLLITLLIAGRAHAQTAVIQGFVTESRREVPLQGANVVVMKDTEAVAGSVTDGDGFFRIPSIPPGQYRLRVSFIGFATWEEGVVLGVGETITRSVALDESDAEVGEVMIVADAESGAAAVMAGLETIRPKDVARIPVPGASGDLAAYVQSLPGVVLPGDRGGRIHVRGGSDDQNLVLVDGVPIYGAFHILSMYSAFPEDVIDAADFYTGGFEADQGSRLSSVLDVRLRNGNKQAFGGSVAMAPFLSGVRIEGPVIPGRASFLLSGRRSLVEDISPKMLGQDMPFRFGDAFSKLHVLLGRGHEFSVFALLTDDSGQVAGSQFTFTGEPVRLADTDSLDLGWDNRVLGGRYTILPGSSPLRMDALVGHSRYRSTFGPEDNPARRVGLESFDAKIEAGLALTSVEVTMGALYRTTSVTYRLQDSFRSTPALLDESFDELAGWVRGDVRLPGGVDLMPGLRLYHVADRGGVQLEPRFRAQWRPGFLGGRHRLSVAWGIVHQPLAGLTDERDIGNPFTVWTPIPTGRELPSSRHAVLGWNGTFDTGFDVAVEAFSKTYTGLQVPIFSALPTFTTTLQSADGSARGVDIRVALTNRPFVAESRLDATVSYSLSRVEYETAGGEKYPPVQDRRHAIGGFVSARRGDISITLVSQVASGLPFTPSSGFDVWHLLTPEVDVATNPGMQRVLYASANSGRQPVYARTDLWIEREIDRGRTVFTVRAGAMNVFNRANLFYFDLFTFRRVNQLPLIPSVGFKAEFR